jgi:hypothetical protein
MESADRSIDLRNLAQRDSLIEPLREIYGVSDKVLAMGCPTVQSNVSANFVPGSSSTRSGATCSQSGLDVCNGNRINDARRPSKASQ